MSVEAFNLYHRQLEWVKQQPKGSRSKAVRNAIDFYHNNKVSQLMKTRDILQDLVLEQSKELEKVKVARQVGGGRVLFALILGVVMGLLWDSSTSAGDVLAYALQLLE
jgi:hypothetical protein